MQNDIVSASVALMVTLFVAKIVFVTVDPPGGPKVDFLKDGRMSAAAFGVWNSSLDPADPPEAVSRAAIQTLPNTRRGLRMT